MRPDKTKPCRAEQTRKQQARSELIQTNQTNAYQDQSTPRHRDQSELNGAFFTSKSRHIKWSSAAAHDSTAQTSFPKAAANSGRLNLES